MSQAILKLANGDKLEGTKDTKPTTPKITYGTRQYDISELDNAMMGNSIDEYLGKQGITGNVASEIKNHISRYYEGFKQGKIKRNVTGNYEISDPSLTTETAPVKRGVFGKIRGDKKQLALGYYNTLFDKMTPYSEPSKEDNQPSQKQKFTSGFGSHLKKQAFRSNNPTETDKSVWYSLADKYSPAKTAMDRYRASLTDDYDFSDTPFQNKEDYINALNQVSLAIDSKDPKALRTALYNIGESDLYSLFQNEAEYKNSKLSPEEKAKIKATEVARPKSEATTQTVGAQPVTKPEEKTAVDVVNPNLAIKDRFDFRVAASGATSDWNPNIKTEPRFINIAKTLATITDPGSATSFGQGAGRSFLKAIANSTPGLNNLIRLRDIYNVGKAAKTGAGNFITYLTEPVVQQKQGGVIKAQTGKKLPSLKNLSPIDAGPIPTLPVVKPSIDLRGPIIKGTGAGLELTPRKSFSPNITANAIGDARFLLTQYLNNKQKFNPTVITTDAPEISAKVQYNTPAESYYGKAADKFRRVGATNATSDQTQNFARQLEAESRAREMEDKGRLASQESYMRTSQAAQDAENKNAMARVANANQNKARMAQAVEAKEAFNRAKDLKRGQNLTNWLFGKQQNLLQKEDVQKSLEMQTLQDQLATDYETSAKDAWTKMNAAQAAYKPESNNNIPWESSSQYQKAYDIYSQALKNAQRTGMQTMRQRQGQLYGASRFLFKKGGSINYAEKRSLEEMKEFNKTLLSNNREFNKLLKLSITEGNKTIRGISSYSANLIKSSLKV